MVSKRRSQFYDNERNQVEAGNRSNRCGICGKKIDGDWDCDHIVPFNKGGETSVDNGQMSHPGCNRSKKDKYQRRDGGPLILRGIGQEFSHDPY